MTYPLAGIKVLDLSRVLAGPFAGRMLADLGADVLKVEPPEGDVTRLWGRQSDGVSSYFHQQNVGKRGVCIDLGQPGANELVLDLAARADVLLENFRPDVMDRLGLGWTTLNARNPRLIMLSISGFGRGGPESARAAYAPIIHAESGVMARQGEYSAAKSADMALSIADTNASLHGLVAVFAALWMRERTGVGQHIDLAMIDAMLVTDDNVHYYLEDAVKTRPMRSEVWQTSFGPVLIAGDFRHLFRQISEQLALADPAQETDSLQGKIAARREAVQRFLLAIPTRDEFIVAMERTNLAWGDVRSPAGAVDLPTVKHRGTITEVGYPSGTRPVVQSPYRFSAAEAGVRGPAPRRGEHNEVALKDWLALSAEQVSALADRGILLQG